MSEYAHSNELSRGVYPERREPDEGEFDRWTRSVLGELRRRLRPFRQRLNDLVRNAELFEPSLAALDQRDLCSQMREAAANAMRNGKLAPALALVREASMRSLGKRPFDTQLMGAATLMAGKLAEMQTGEGKTLTAALAACVASCAGVPVHVVTVNDYLAERDAEDMRALFEYLGLSVGVIVTGMSLEARRRAYACDICYCTNKELVFDYLKDRVSIGDCTSKAQIKIRDLFAGPKHDGILLRGLHFAIVDEADSIMIDESRTPLILAEKGASVAEPALYEISLNLARSLKADRDYELSLERHSVHLTRAGCDALAYLCNEMQGVWRSIRAREHLVTQALRALWLFERDKHYLVSEDKKVQIIDEYTGRVLPGRTWEQGLHQMIETKEDCPLSEQNRTLARITYQRFFRRYLTLSGMTGTAREVARELYAVYRLEVVDIPTNRPCIRVSKRHRCYPDEASKWRGVARQASELSSRGVPVLIGTRSVEASERLSEVLNQFGLDHRVLNARQDAQEAEVVARAGLAGMISVATNMAGRGTDIALGTDVASRGGLHVILTEFHDSPRIDRQLIGRCARQGDPGCAMAMVALDDALFRAHGGVLLATVAPLLKRYPLAPIIGVLRWYSQRGAERIHSRERRDTLKQDRDIDSMLAFAGNQI